MEHKIISKSEWKDKWDVNTSALKVYPNKKLAAICLISVFIIIFIDFIFDGFKFAVVIIPLSILCIGEAYLTRRFLLTCSYLVFKFLLRMERVQRNIHRA